MAEYELNLRDYWRIIRKRKNVVIFSSLVLALLTFSITVIVKPQPLYEATASVKIDEFTSMTGLILESFSRSSGDTLATQEALIMSFPVMERVAKVLGFIQKDISAKEIRTNPQYAQIISGLRSKISTEREGYTTIINITATTNKPEEANLMANTVAEEFREYNILKKNMQTVEARRFIEKQMKLVEKQVKEVEEALTRFREKEEIITISEEQNNLLRRYSNLEEQRDRVISETKVLKAEIALIEEKKALSNETSDRFVLRGESPQILRLNALLSDLLLERENRLINYLPAHPKVKNLNDQIQNISEEMGQELLSILEALKREKSSIEERLGGLKREVALLPGTALELSRLERELTISEELFSLLKSKYQEALIKESEKIEEVSIVRHAFESTMPINPPKTFANTSLGFIVGILFGFIVAFLWESLDTSIGTIEDVEAYLGLPVLGVIPYIDYNEIKDELRESFPGNDEEMYDIYAALHTHFLPRSVVSESYRALRTNLQFLQKDEGLKTLLVSSSSPDEGKTINILNLSIAIAQMGMRVLLIDADLRKHSLHYYFGLDLEPGLTDAILGNVRWDNAVNDITDVMLGKLNVEDILKTSGLDNLSILTSGTVHTHNNPSELLGSDAFGDMLEEMKEYYDYILFDTPPILPVADALILSSKVDGVLIVYKVGQVDRSALKRAKLLMENVDARVLGITLNGLKAETSPDFLHASYYYGASEDEKPSKKPVITGVEKSETFNEKNAD